MRRTPHGIEREELDSPVEAEAAERAWAWYDSYSEGAMHAHSVATV